MLGALFRFRLSLWVVGFRHWGLFSLWSDVVSWGLFGLPAGRSFAVAWGYICSVRLLLGCLALLSGKVFFSATMVLFLAGQGGTW